MNPGFDHTQYVPVLRWKRGERWALQKLNPGIRRRITPIIELIPQNFEDDKLQKDGGLNGRLGSLTNEIHTVWGRTPFLVDCIHVEGLFGATGEHPLARIGQEVRLRFLSGIPVTGPARSTREREAAVSFARVVGHGIAVRVTASELAAPSFARDFSSLAAQVPGAFRSIDVILDFSVLDGDRPRLDAIIRAFPHVTEIRSLAFLAGAFPADLCAMEKNNQYEVERSDWIEWKRLVSSGARPIRLPAFGDYTVQYAEYRDPPSFCNPSASIRYAADEYWVVMRGEGILNDHGPGRKGYLGNAMLLVERSEFRGADFSEGDAYIDAMSQQDAKTGSPETWIRAAINHHLTLTVRQIASQFGTATAA